MTIAPYHPSLERSSVHDLCASTYPVVDISTKYANFCDFERQVIEKTRLLDKCLEFTCIDESLASNIKSLFYVYRGLDWKKDRLSWRGYFINKNNISVADYGLTLVKTSQAIKSNLSDCIKQIILKSKTGSTYGHFSIGISFESSYRSLPSALSSSTKLGVIMIQAWKHLSSQQYKRGMGNTTNKNYGNLSFYRDKGIEMRNRQVKVTDPMKLFTYCKSQERDTMVLGESAQKQIRCQSHEYRKISSHL